jgi:hypothetical protein
MPFCHILYANAMRYAKVSYLLTLFICYHVGMMRFYVTIVTIFMAVFVAVPGAFAQGTATPTPTPTANPPYYEGMYEFESQNAPKMQISAGWVINTITGRVLLRSVNYAGTPSVGFKVQGRFLVVYKFWAQQENERLMNVCIDANPCVAIPAQTFYIAGVSLPFAFDLGFYGLHDVVIKFPPNGANRGEGSLDHFYVIQGDPTATPPAFVPTNTPAPPTQTPGGSTATPTPIPTATSTPLPSPTPNTTVVFVPLVITQDTSETTLVNGKTARVERTITAGDLAIIAMLSIMTTISLVIMVMMRWQLNKR